MIDSDFNKKSIPRKLEIALKLMGYKFDPANAEHKYIASIDIIPPPNEKFLANRAEYSRKYVKLVFTDNRWSYMSDAAHDAPELIQLLKLHKERVNGNL